MDCTFVCDIPSTDVPDEEIPHRLMILLWSFLSKPLAVNHEAAWTRSGVIHAVR